ncbi:MAG: hypothetical protein ABIO67_11855 [Mycobacteriales bacterium]
MLVITREFGLSRAEWATTATAAAVSTAGYLVGGHDYLARGVVGDMAGFVVLAGIGLASRGRLRHEAAGCLVAIGVVVLANPQWPLRLGEGTWWAIFTAGLLSYVALRRRLCD